MDEIAILSDSEYEDWRPEKGIQRALAGKDNGNSHVTRGNKCKRETIGNGGQSNRAFGSRLDRKTDNTAGKADGVIAKLIDI